MSDVCVVLVTCPTAEDAAALARTLVAERLAACGNIVPGVRSLFRWQGAVQDEAEVLLLLKTAAARVPELTGRVQSLHPYDVPEVLALPVLGGLPVYLGWVKDSTTSMEEK